MGADGTGARVPAPDASSDPFEPGAVDVEPPGYPELYYLWERLQWSAGGVDLTADRGGWQEMPGALREALLVQLAPFYAGRERTASALVPFVDAAPTEEQQVFLTTQLVDEARHTVFFDRFHDEVANEGGDGIERRMERQAERLGPGSRSLLFEMLPEAAERIRTGPDDPDLLVEGVLLYHIVIEATLGLTGQRFILRFARERDILPGFCEGLVAMARDTSRHVSFGVRFLRQMVTDDVRRAVLIRELLRRVLPVAMSAIDPPRSHASCYDALPYGPAELKSFAADTLATRLSVIGVEPVA